MSESNTASVEIDLSITDEDERLEHIQSVRMKVAKDLLANDDPKFIRLGLDALKHAGDTIVAKKRIAVEDKQQNNQALVLETLARLQSNFGNVNPFERTQQPVDVEEAPRNRPEVYADISHLPKAVFSVGDQGLNAKNFIKEYEENNPIGDDDEE